MNMNRDGFLPGGTQKNNMSSNNYKNTQRISDRNALAAIMGNIKQESNFIPTYAREGWRVSYDACRSGGYGLIQWTSINRYNNLGKFCEKYGCDPSSLEGQTRYMINESTFQRYLPEFEGRGFTVSVHGPCLLLVGMGHQRVTVKSMLTSTQTNLLRYGINTQILVLTENRTPVY